MNLSDTAWSFIAGVLVLAILYVLVRPGSAAGAAISDVGSALTALVRTTVS